MGILDSFFPLSRSREPRGVSHYIPEGDCCDTRKKCLVALNFMLRGLPFIYQGQELGMENILFKFIDEVDDISTLMNIVALDAGLYFPKTALKAAARRSRADNARTPMQWTGEKMPDLQLVHRGFCKFQLYRN